MEFKFIWGYMQNGGVQFFSTNIVMYDTKCNTFHGYYSIKQASLLTFNAKGGGPRTRR